MSALYRMFASLTLIDFSQSFFSANSVRNTNEHMHTASVCCGGKIHDWVPQVVFMRCCCCIAKQTHSETNVTLFHYILCECMAFAIHIFGSCYYFCFSFSSVVFVFSIFSEYERKHRQKKKVRSCVLFRSECLRSGVWLIEAFTAITSRTFIFHRIGRIARAYFIVAQNVLNSFLLNVLVQFLRLRISVQFDWKENFIFLHFWPWNWLILKVPRSFSV